MSQLPPSLHKLLCSNPVRALEALCEIKMNEFQKQVVLSKSPRVVVLSPRQSGKSTVLAAMALRTLLTPDASGKPGKVVVFAPAIRQSTILLDKCRSVLFRWGIQAPTCNRSEIVLENGASIVSRPVKPSSRGENCSLMLLDELAFLETVAEEDVLSVAMPYLSRPGSRLIVSSTPRSLNGLFYRLWNEENDFEKIRGDVTQVAHYDVNYLASQREMLGELYAREFDCSFSEIEEHGLFDEYCISKFLGEEECKTEPSLAEPLESTLPVVERARITLH